jgi:hypothetical protein
MPASTLRTKKQNDRSLVLFEQILHLEFWYWIVIWYTHLLSCTIFFAQYLVNCWCVTHSHVITSSQLCSLAALQPGFIWITLIYRRAYNRCLLEDSDSEIWSSHLLLCNQILGFVAEILGENWSQNYEISYWKPQMQGLNNVVIEKSVSVSVKPDKGYILFCDHHGTSVYLHGVV